MAILNPTEQDFINNQYRGLDPYEYRDSYAILRANSFLYRVFLGEDADDLYNDRYFYVVMDHDSFNVTVTRQAGFINVYVTKGTAIVNNQPIVFGDDFEFQIPIPANETTYHVQLKYMYNSGIPHNYAYIDICECDAPPTGGELSVAKFTVDPANLPSDGNSIPVEDLRQFPDNNFDAGTLDGLDSDQFLRSDVNDEASGIIHFINTENATSPETGAVIVDGGVGIAKDLYIGGSLNIEGAFENDGIMHITDATDANNPDSGALQVDGGTGINKKLYVGDELHVTNTSYFSDIEVSSNANISGVLNITNTTNATSPNNGALHVDGGVGIAQDLHVGGTIHGNITGTAANADKLDGLDSTQFLRSDATDIATGEIDFRGNIKVTKINPSVPVNQLIINAGESDGKVSNQTGEYVYVNAEAGLSVNTPDAAHNNWDSGYTVKNTIVKGDLIDVDRTSSKTTRIQGDSIIVNRTGTQRTRIFDNSITMYANVGAGNSTENTLYINMYDDGSAGQISILNKDGNSISDLVLHSDGRLTYTNDFITSGTIHTTSGADASSVDTGALQVDGGVGINKKLYVGGNTYLINDLNVSGSTNLAGITHVTDTTDASSVDTGALQVDGGVGINKNLYVGGTIYGNVQGTISNADTLDGIDSSQFLRSDTDDIASGKYHFTNTGDVSLTSDGAITIGQNSGVNISIDNNEIQSRNNGAASPLYINSNGGAIDFGGTIQSRLTSGIVFQADSNADFYKQITINDGAGDFNILSNWDGSNNYLGSGGAARITLDTENTDGKISLKVGRQGTAGNPVVDIQTLSLDSNSGEMTWTGNTIIQGDLTVNGTTTTIDTSNLQVSDALIGLQTDLDSSTANSNDMGIIMERGASGDNAAFIWDESTDRFVVGTTTATATDSGSITVTPGTIQAHLDGNADTASKWVTARTLSLSGDLTGSVTFDGSSNMTLSAQVLDDSHLHHHVAILDNRNAGDVAPDDLPDHDVFMTFTDDITGSPNTWDAVINVKGWTDGYRAWQLLSNSSNSGGDTNLYFRSGVGNSWGPLQRVWTSSNDGSGSELDADLLDGHHGSFYQNASNINAGTLSADRLPSVINSDTSGNAATADKWSTTRTISLTGEASGSASIDGSSDITIDVTLNIDGGTY